MIYSAAPIALKYIFRTWCGSLVAKVLTLYAQGSHMGANLCHGKIFLSVPLSLCIYAFPMKINKSKTKKEELKNTTLYLIQPLRVYQENSIRHTLTDCYIIECPESAYLSETFCNICINICMQY